MDIQDKLRRNRTLATVACGLTMILGCGTGISPLDRCISNADCDDGVFCNGEEYCSIDEADVARCFDRENPCDNPVGCNEETDQCELD